MAGKARIVYGNRLDGEGTGGPGAYGTVLCRPARAGDELSRSVASVRPHRRPLTRFLRRGDPVGANH